MEIVPDIFLFELEVRLAIPLLESLDPPCLAVDEERLAVSDPEALGRKEL